MQQIACVKLVVVFPYVPLKVIGHILSQPVYTAGLSFKSSINLCMKLLKLKVIYVKTCSGRNSAVIKKNIKIYKNKKIIIFFPDYNSCQFNAFRCVIFRLLICIVLYNILCYPSGKFKNKMKI